MGLGLAHRVHSGLGGARRSPSTFVAPTAKTSPGQLAIPCALKLPSPTHAPAWQMVTSDILLPLTLVQTFRQPSTTMYMQSATLLWRHTWWPSLYCTSLITEHKTRSCASVSLPPCRYRDGEQKLSMKPSELTGSSPHQANQKHEEDKAQRRREAAGRAQTVLVHTKRAMQPQHLRWPAS